MDEVLVPMTEFLLGRLRSSYEHPPKTFATHYHELNEMSGSLSRIQNYNVAVKELKDTVLLLEN
jgi:DNA mismatch repair ATPase MutS